jgi:serine phosphatase RsbU (regulator of sigma subunit)
LTNSGRRDGQPFDNDIAGANNGVLQDLATAPGFKSRRELERTELSLRCGDALVFYTDGVSEAFNPEDVCYGEERFLADAGTFVGRSALASTVGLLQKVRAFAGSAPQSDDIAMLALGGGGGSPGKEGYA